MSTPLTTLTRNPVQYDTFTFGGDDTELGNSGFINTIASWDRDSAPDTWKAQVVFFVKKSFDFMDAIGMGTFFFGLGGFNRQLREADYYQTGLERNGQARERIVAALGGEAVCERIPVVNINQNDFTDYLKLGDQYFSGGQWLVQGEDPAGRKFALMRVANRAGQVFLATVQQRYRETCIHGISGGGSLWAVNIINLNRHESGFAGTNEAVDFVQKVRTNQHPEFTIALKP